MKILTIAKIVNVQEKFYLCCFIMSLLLSTISVLNEILYLQKDFSFFRIFCLTRNIDLRFFINSCIRLFVNQKSVVETLFSLFTGTLFTICFYVKIF